MKKLLFYNSITYVWLLLVVMTSISWMLGDSLASKNVVSGHWPVVALMLIAFFKVRLVIMHFMEVATALLPLRIAFEMWVLVVCGAILALYFGLF